MKYKIFLELSDVIEGALFSKVSLEWILKKLASYIHTIDSTHPLVLSLSMHFNLSPSKILDKISEIIGTPVHKVSATNMEYSVLLPELLRWIVERTPHDADNSDSDLKRFWAEFVACYPQDIVSLIQVLKDIAEEDSIEDAIDVLQQKALQARLSSAASFFYQFADFLEQKGNEYDMSLSLTDLSKEDWEEFLERLDHVMPRTLKEKFQSFISDLHHALKRLYDKKKNF